MALIRATSGSGGGGTDLSDISGLIPRLTSNTGSNGSTIYSSQYSASNYPAYYTASTSRNISGWLPSGSGTTNNYIGYTFTSAVTIQFGTIGLLRYDNTSNCNIKLQASNDGTNFVDLSDNISITSDEHETLIPVTKNKGSYTSYRFFSDSGLTGGGGNAYIGVRKMQLYGQ